MGGFFNSLLHLDKNIQHLIANFGGWAYLVLFLIIFAETGLVFCPFLPGDTLLFAVGLYARPEKHAFSLPIALVLLILAAMSGDQSNYHMGKFFGMRWFTNEKSKFFKKSNLDKTHEYFERRGPSTVIFARFIPIVRTTAPFVAGMGTMQHRLFTMFSAAAAVLWVGICMMSGFLFGAIPAVQNNFGLAAIGMLLLSLIPLTYEVLTYRSGKKKGEAAKAGVNPAP
jgi:membrane-associated protein